MGPYRLWFIDDSSMIEYYYLRQTDCRRTYNIHIAPLLLICLLRIKFTNHGFSFKKHVMSCIQSIYVRSLCKLYIEKSVYSEKSVIPNKRDIIIITVNLFNIWDNSNSVLIWNYGDGYDSPWKTIHRFHNKSVISLSSPRDLGHFYISRTL